MKNFLCDKGSRWEIRLKNPFQYRPTAEKFRDGGLGQRSWGPAKGDSFLVYASFRCSISTSGQDPIDWGGRPRGVTQPHDLTHRDSSVWRSAVALWLPDRRSLVYSGAAVAGQAYLYKCCCRLISINV